MVDKSGILAASDAEQEWLLPWWWENLQRVGNYPVVFADFGMSEKARVWCKERGDLISVDGNLPDLQKIDPALLQEGKESYGETFCRSRLSWFKKPFAMEKTPFRRTLWLDLDCEVIAPLEPLFESEMGKNALALVSEIDNEANSKSLLEGETLYNSGVILYDMPSELISLWKESVATLHSQFKGDQDLLSRLIFTHGFSVLELSPHYNWRMALSRGILFDARIIHWVGSWGKAFIRKEGGLIPFLSRMKVLEDL